MVSSAGCCACQCSPWQCCRWAAAALCAPYMPQRCPPDGSLGLHGACLKLDLGQAGPAHHASPPCSAVRQCSACSAGGGGLPEADGHLRLCPACLQHRYFYTEPLACAPEEMPVYPDSHEMDMKHLKRGGREIPMGQQPPDAKRQRMAPPAAQGPFSQ